MKLIFTVNDRISMIKISGNFIFDVQENPYRKMLFEIQFDKSKEYP